ncbi:MAG: phosphomannomutase [Planctomycetaceae bacterium]|nr:phosphomannomutase [Planctomycetaceae bacterium]
MTTTIHDLMTNSNVKFGTSGVRGLVADMNDFVCFTYTLGFLQYAAANGQKFDKVAVAYDLRRESPRIARAVFRAIEHFGLTPVNCGKVPTPCLGLYGFSEKIPSIMVTGSHIPEDRNGIKFYMPEGEVLKNDENGIRNQVIDISQEKFNELFDGLHMLQPRTRTSSIVEAQEIAENRYVERYIRALPKNCLSGLRLGIYEHSSVASDLLFRLYTELSASVTRLGHSERFVAVDTEALRDEDTVAVSQWALGKNLPPTMKVKTDEIPFDAILSADGDGDRPLIFDEFGNWIRGDIIGVITARFLLADYVVTPVSSSTVLERSGWFKNVNRTKIGSPFVIEKMQEAVKNGFQRVCGYEANGGFLTASPIFVDEDFIDEPLSPLPTRDPVIVHIGTLCYAKRNNMSLSDLIRGLPKRVVMSDRLKNFPPEIAQQRIEDLSLGGLETLGIIFASYGDLVAADYTDGIRMIFGNDDIVHLRPSGNAPELRCYTESDTRDRAAMLLYRTMTILDSWRRKSQNESYPNCE